MWVLFCGDTEPPAGDKRKLESGAGTPKNFNSVKVFAVRLPPERVPKTLIGVVLLKPI